MGAGAWREQPSSSPSTITKTLVARIAPDYATRAAASPAPAAAGAETPAPTARYTAADERDRVSVHMGTIDLRLRDLESAELLIASFESEEDAATWLRERPPMMEVIGLIAESSDPAVHVMLRGAARPLDPDEAEIVGRMDAADAVARAAREEEHARRAAAEAEAHREEMRSADPDRPMQVAWGLTEGFAMMDPADEREITQAAKDAVLEWVRERDGWVADREQVVSEAALTVWPAAVPQGQSRVQPGGKFIPAARPPSAT